MNYNRIAPVYYTIQKAVFGIAQERVQLQLFPFFAEGSILLVGPGNSHLPLQILQRKPQAHLLLVEPTPFFFEKIKSQLAKYSNVEVKNCSLQELVVHPKNRYPTILLPFVIDSIESSEWPSFYNALLTHSAIGTRFCISEFSEAVSLRQKVLEFSMHLFFRYFAQLKRTHYPKINELFPDSNFKCIHHKNHGIFTNWVFERIA